MTVEVIRGDCREQPPLLVVESPGRAPRPLTVPRMSAREVCRRLADRHCRPEWSTFIELRCGTGFAGYRYKTSAQRIDVFAVNTWPSKKYLSVAYEVKVSRGDFLRELRMPRKRLFAESVANECYFATPCGLIRPDELPEGWGLIESWGERTRIRVQAQYRKPDPWPMHFIASMLRSGTANDD